MIKWFSILIKIFMSRLQTNAKKKLNKALVRVDKVVIMDVRRNMEQQKKWKAEIMKRQKKNSII